MGRSGRWTWRRRRLPRLAASRTSSPTARRRCTGRMTRDTQAHRDRDQPYHSPYAPFALFAQRATPMLTPSSVCPNGACAPVVAYGHGMPRHRMTVAFSHVLCRGVAARRFPVAVTKMRSLQSRRHSAPPLTPDGENNTPPPEPVNSPRAPGWGQPGVQLTPWRLLRP